jgi:hypothetical protein
MRGIIWILCCKLYLVHTVHMLTVNVLPKKTILYEIHIAYTKIHKIHIYSLYVLFVFYDEVHLLDNLLI